MLTPELQQYINQQRSAGVSDAQIRQALGMQGWTRADLDQAFGAQTSVVGHKAKNIPLIIGASVVGLALILGIGYAAYYKSSKKTETPTQKNNSAGQSNTTGQKLCGDWPKTQSDSDYLTGAKFFSKITDSSVANGITIYPGVVKIIEINVATGNSTTQQIVTCAKSTTVPSVANYYKALGGYSVSEISSLPAAYSINTNLGSLKAVQIVDTSSGALFIYDAGNRDSLLLYTHH